MRLLVANRGEIAVRIMRAAAELGISTVAVYSEDDAQALHVRRAGQAHALRGVGALPYLNIDAIVAAAKECDCDAIHPGYGFLSEQAEFARRAEAAGITYVGPRPDTLDIFGRKTLARDLAEHSGVPVLRGTSGPLTLDGAHEFIASLGPGATMVIKAVAGGGGRGMRVVSSTDDVAEAYARCHSEATQAFGNGDLYAEEYMPRARHIEVQIAGDGTGAVTHFWERECSIQRRHQKIVELAPSPALHPALRDRILADAVRLAAKVSYRNLGTFEFLVEADAAADSRHAFIEANARLQVEHTVTEEILDLDLVKTQLRLAQGATLAGLGLTQDLVPAPRGYAVQVRVNMETMDAEGNVRPSGGTLAAFDIPSGRGIRVDTGGYAGYRTSPNFDSLLAKVIGHSNADFADAVAVTYRALCEFNITGVRTNISLLQNLLRHPDFIAGRIDTRFVEDHIAELVAGTEEEHPRLFFGGESAIRVGAKIDALDPLAVLNYGRSGDSGAQTIAQPALGPTVHEMAGPDGTTPIRAPVQATIVSFDVREGDVVKKGQQVMVLNAMKMEHVVRAPASGIVRLIVGEVGESVPEGVALIFFEEQDIETAAADEAARVDLDHLRPDLAEVERRRALTTDQARAEVVAIHHAKDRRTARENILDLCDPGTFVQYGPLGVGQGLQGNVDELLGYAPSDGMVMGLGQINGEQFGLEKSRAVIMSYDYTVLAGTQGGLNHRMKDRMFETADKLRVPVVLFAEGGGGRAGGGTRGGANFRNAGGGISGGGGLHVPTWNKQARLSGLVPLVGVVSGRCFAGNAALLGICDVIIATPDASIGMGGPAMIEGGGLGVYRPEEVGPVSVQSPNGVIDILVQDEAEAITAVKKYLSYFQGPLSEWECADQRLLRTVVPENRLRVYDMRNLIETLADTDSVLEIRRDFGRAMITALIRIEGRPVGVIANNPLFMSGAIDSPAADKAARFMQLCDAYDIPLLFLCDTPGIMVGPEAEKTALVRHANRLFILGASCTIPTFTVVIRKAYGLGAQTMGGGNHNLPIFVLSWPTGEFGGMGLEGQVKLGRRRELESIEDPNARRERYEELVAQAYERGKAINAGHVFEVDDVIDPADTRRWLSAGLRSAPQPLPRSGKKRPCIDAW